MKKKKYLWYTDCHLDKANPISFYNIFTHIKKENPDGIFLTGDISNGLLIKYHLELLEKITKRPIYFILGNHDYHFSSFEKIEEQMRLLCIKNDNLIWLTNSDIIHLSDEAALIGTKGWYDASIGNPNYLNFTVDWFLIKEFRNKSLDERISMFKERAKSSSDALCAKLKKALEAGYKTVYILTHFPPWKEATRDIGTALEKFWLPYNVNFTLGSNIEKVMADRNKRHALILAGHTHTDCWIHVSRNIECKVNNAKYYGSIRNEETIFV